MLDTIHDSEIIKMELWKIAYGVWNHIKNSGQFSEAETLTLEWVGTIPGKRESRRFEGDLILSQQDVVEQRLHPDAVSFGGWAIDLHPVDGVYSPQSGCTQWHAKGVYQIPWRTMYSRNISNLMLAGRIISASHVAFASTRVMATSAHGGQAVGMAAALCLREGIQPRDLLEPARMRELQRRLLRAGQFIPGVVHDDPTDLAWTAKITASSELTLSVLPPCGETLPLTESWAMVLPVSSGPMPVVSFTVNVSAATALRAELRISGTPDNHTPDVILKSLEIPLSPGYQQSLPLDFTTAIDEARFAFVSLLKNDSVAVHLSDQRLTGVLALCQAGNLAVAKSNTQSPPPDIGIDTFEFWTPKRRPAGKNLAMRIEPAIRAFSAENLTNGISRPTRATNAWAADFADEQPVVRLTWDTPQTIAIIEINFDTDFDHPMESVLMGHPERDMPCCVSDVKVTAAMTPDRGDPSDHPSTDTLGQPATRIVAEIIGNHQARRIITLETPVTTDCLELHVRLPSTTAPAALFAVRCFGCEPTTPLKMASQ